MLSLVKAAAKDNCMDMRMEIHLAAPGMEDTDISDIDTEIFVVGSQFPQCIGRGMIKSVVKGQPILINAARGGVVDEKALEQAIDKGYVRTAIIDTWEQEPFINRSLLKKVFIGTPHIAGYSADGKANATRMTLEALARWIGRTELFNRQPPSLPDEFVPVHDERELALQFYNPMDDNDRLKQNPDLFEHLRSHYPLRRESFSC